MNALSSQHDVFNPAGDAVDSVFPNDFSSKNTLEKLAQQEALEQTKKKKAADELAELERLRMQHPTLEAQNRALEAQKATLENQKAALESQKASAEAQKAQRDQDVVKLERQISEFKRQVLQFNQDFDLMKPRLGQSDYRFNLDSGYHDRDVQIMLAAWPHTALDLGGNNGQHPHGYEYNTSYAWQRVRLRRTDTNSSTSSWTICNLGMDIWLGIGPDGKPQNQRGRHNDSNSELKRKQEWYIGLNSLKTGYLIESVPSAWLELAEPTENKNGKEVRNSGKNEANPGQTWHIILK